MGSRMDSIQGLKILKSKIGHLSKDEIDWQQFLDKVIRELEVKSMMERQIRGKYELRRDNKSV